MEMTTHVIHVTMTYKYIHFHEMKILKSNINIKVQRHMLMN